MVKEGLLIDDGAGLIYQALGAGDGTFAITTTLLFTLPANTVLIDAVDMNGDGFIDFVGYDNVLNNVVVVLAISATTYATPVSYASSSVSGGFDYNINVADVNNDGSPDVTVQSNTPNHIAVLLGNNTGFLATPALYPLSVAAQGSRLVDVNSDGFLDVVASLRSATGDSLAVLLNDGAGGFGAEVLYPLGGTPNTTHGDLKIADFNLDGRADVLSVQNQKVAVLLGDGVGGFAAPLSFPFISGVGGSIVWGVVVGDINGDTKPDVVVKADDGIGFLTFSNFPLINASTTSLITGAIVINGGNATTTNAGVTLNLTCLTSTGAACANSTIMAFSDDGSNWIAQGVWSSTSSWTVPTVLGSKTVYVKFTDINNNTSTANDTIELVSPSLSASNGCLAPSQSSALYLFMLLGLLFAASQLRSRR